MSAQCRASYHDPTLDVCDRFNGCMERLKERLLPLKCESFRDSFFAVHESAYGTFRPFGPCRKTVAFGAKRTLVGAGTECVGSAPCAIIVHRQSSPLRCLNQSSRKSA